jgi:hypothetical protein
MSISRLRLAAPKRIRLAIVTLIFSMPVSLLAQSQGRTNTNTASAVLHIRVNVVQTVLPPKPESQPVERSSVNYIIPVVNTQNQTIVSESAVPASPQKESCTGMSCSAVLRTTTIIAY